MGTSTKLMTRMGDGTAVEMTREELRADIEDGVAAAVKRAKVPPLDDDEALTCSTSSPRRSA